MADKTIGSLPQAQSVDDSSLFVCEQQGTAMKTTGAQWKGFAVNAVSQYVEPAQQAAQQAQQAAQQAQDAVSQIGTAVEDTQANAQAAQEAKEAAETAQGKAEDAQEAAESAADGVEADALAAEQAKNAAVTAQGAAEGARDTAQGYAMSASESAATATQKAEEAAGSAVDAAQSAASIEGDVEAAQTAATQAAGSASAAAGSASAAADSASDAAGSATAASESATAASGSAQAAASSASAALQSETSAETAASNAAQSETNASGFAGAASESATAAAGSASTASQAASDAQSAQTLAETARAGAEDAETGAEAARDAILNMLVEAITLETGKPATVTKSLVDQVYKLTFGLPKGNTGATGATGPQGVSVESIQLTSGNHAPGTTDTYTITLSDDSTFQFTVYNGANGTGAGDFMADGSVPMTGALDMGGQRVTNVGAPTASTDAVRQSDLKAVSDEVDDIISGTTAITIPAATEAKRGGVIIGDGLSVTEDGTVSADDQLPTGGTQGQVLTQGTTGPEWQDAPSGLPDGGTPGQVLTQGESGPEWTNAPDPLPTGGETGQVLTKTAEGTAWDDIPSDLPAGGTDGQILTKTAEGVAWEDAPAVGVTSFKGRTGAVTPQDGDYTADMVGARPDTWTPSAADVGAVPTSRTVNGKALSRNISLTASDVGARANTWTPTASDVGAIPDPSGGTTGQILEKTATGTQWADKPSSGISQSEADARYLQLSGGTIDGTLQIGTGESEDSIPGEINLTIFNPNVRPTGPYISSIKMVDGVIPAEEGSIPGGNGYFGIRFSDAVKISGTSNGCSLIVSGTINGVKDPVYSIDAANKAYVDSLKPTRLTATLNASSWSGNSQTITVNGVITNTSAQDIDISCADKASADAWAAGGVWCSNPTQANRLTFTCTTPPTANINLNIRLWEVG